MIKGLAPTEYWRLVPNYILLNYLILMLYIIYYGGFY